MKRFIFYKITCPIIALLNILLSLKYINFLVDLISRTTNFPLFTQI